MVYAGLMALLASLPLTEPAAEPTPIYGGAKVEAGAWPNVAAVIVPPYLCTGTLVSDRVILTAAHCLERGEPAGLIDVVLGDDIYSGPRYTVERYGLHPKYCGSDPEKCRVDVWDFAYLVLDEPVPGVAPALPLVTQEAWDEAMAVDAAVTMVGFGWNEKMLSGVKREVEAPIVKFSPSGLEFQAGGLGLDTCNGDSGGPAFVTLASGEILLAGVTSRGFSECGKGGFYGVPYAALCWLNAETGVDLRGEQACEACDCIVTGEPSEGCGCAVGAARSMQGTTAMTGGTQTTTGAALLVLVLLGLGRRRRRA